MSWQLILSVSALNAVATATVYIGSYLSLDQKKSSKKNEETVQQNNEQVSVELSYYEIIIMPISSSLCLVMLFFFFQYLQYVLILILVSGAVGALFQLTQFTLQKINQSISTRYSTIISCFITALITLEWLRTGNFIAHNLLACSLCLMFISTVKFPNLKLAVLCLSLLVIYDIFWVFYSEYWFKSNVMVEVATKVAVNPIQQVVSQITSNPIITEFFTRTLELPIKLIFPTGAATARGSLMLGLGDICLPGAFVSLALRCDEMLSPSTDELLTEDYNTPDLEEGESESQTLLVTTLQSGASLLTLSGKHKKSGVLSIKSRLFEWCLVGYFLGMTAAFVGNFVYSHAQPALIYLVPGVVMPFIVRAYLCGVLNTTWNGVGKDE